MIVRTIVVKILVGVRLLEFVAAFSFAVLVAINWSYHGCHRPWEFDVATFACLSFCFVTEILFWIVRRIHAVLKKTAAPGDKARVDEITRHNRQM